MKRSSRRSAGNHATLEKKGIILGNQSLVQTRVQNACLISFQEANSAGNHSRIAKIRGSALRKSEYLDVRAAIKDGKWYADILMRRGNGVLGKIRREEIRRARSYARGTELSKLD